MRYGGNTSCVEICDGDRRLIFDAGSGIRELGTDVYERGPNEIHIFLTHFHWDHIQGFPFFRPLYDAEDTITVLGPQQRDIDVQNIFAGQMGPIYFPVPFSVVAATMAFEHLNEGSYEIDGFTLDVMRVRHPSFVVGYRIRLRDSIVCYVPDNELDGEMYPDAGPDFRARMLEFVAGADLLIHDAMYTDAEYPGRKGWGHSTFEQAVDLARDAEVKELLFFHHDPTRTDDELDDIVARMQDEVSGDALTVGAAMEGVYYELEDGS